MNRYYYDLHLHSCLSPCGSEDMTPSNIAGMAMLAGLQIVALTDHNSTKNCPAFYEACKTYGLIPVAGMELTTAEDIHMVCLFETLEQAMVFGEAVDKRRILISNKPSIWGTQQILNASDEIIGEDPYLLPNATEISLEEGFSLVEAYGGLCYPAHIDRPAGGVLSILGAFPETPRFTAFEVNHMETVTALAEKHPVLNSLVPVVSSDAHYLDQIPDAENCFDLPDEPYSGDFVRKQLFDKLRNL